VRAVEPKFGQAEERGEREASEGSSCASRDGVLVNDVW
jgi:hypothetical protein